jgi:FkbM family methyltransferase
MSTRGIIGGLGARVQYALLRSAGLASAVSGYRGMQRVAWTLAPRFNPDNAVVVELPLGGRLRFRLRDGYWAPLLAPGFHYEPDIESELLAAANRRCDILDLGANIGYWSAVAGSRGARVISVEATPDIFQQLEANATLNQGSFTPVHAAVWEVDDETVQIVAHTHRHAGNSIVDRADRVGEAGYTTHEVWTTTIDTLVDRYLPDRSRPLVIKLDVEGAEIPAVRGAQRTLRDRAVTLLYEDHGQDPDCLASRFLQASGLSLFHGGRPITVEQIAALKTNSAKGYNFLARNPLSGNLYGGCDGRVAGGYS